MRGVAWDGCREQDLRTGVESGCHDVLIPFTVITVDKILSLTLLYLVFYVLYLITPLIFAGVVLPYLTYRGGGYEATRGCGGTDGANS